MTSGWGAAGRVPTCVTALGHTAGGGLASGRNGAAAAPIDPPKPTAYGGYRSVSSSAPRSVGTHLGYALDQDAMANTDGDASD